MFWSINRIFHRSIRSSTSCHFVHHHRQSVHIDYDSYLLIDHYEIDYFHEYSWNSPHHHLLPNENLTDPREERIVEEGEEQRRTRTYFEIFVIIFHGEGIGIQRLIISCRCVVTEEEIESNFLSINDDASIYP